MNPSRSDFKYPSDFGFLKNCRIPSDSESVTSLATITKKAKFSAIRRNWSQLDLDDNDSTDDGNQQTTFLNREAFWNPAKLFQLFFDDAVISTIVQHSISYACTSGDRTFQLDSDELWLFFALLLLSGYTVLPRRRMYWERLPDVQNEAFRRAMPRNCFEEILRFLHLADNSSLPENDRFGKVRPLLSQLNERWLLYAPNESKLSIDESMVPYYSRHGAKQHLHGMPIRFGFKIWSLTTVSGYMLQCEPYQGASTGNTKPELGLGGSVVVDLISELPRDRKYMMYFDNFFTSLRLMDYLRCEGFGATGTIRANRAEGAPLTDVKKFSKENRGTFEYRQDVSSGTLLVRWQDNSVVTFATNCHSAMPTVKTKRWSNKEKRTILVDQPRVVAAYNRCMRGVDRLHQNVSTYRISIRMKKWWWPMFSFLLSVSVNNAWQLYRLCSSYATEKLDLLNFNRHLVIAYLQRYSSKNGIGLVIDTTDYAADRRVLPEVRFDKVTT